MLQAAASYRRGGGCYVCAGIDNCGHACRLVSADDRLPRCSRPQVLGERVGPHLSIIASGLPQVWSRAEVLSTAAASAAEATSLLDKDAAARRRDGVAAAAAEGGGGNAAGGSSRPAAAGTSAPGGGRAKPGAVAAAKPSAGASGDTDGAVVRLHSALIAVLTHLVGKLRSGALEDRNICGVVFPLLKYSTRVGECAQGSRFAWAAGKTHGAWDVSGASRGCRVEVTDAMDLRNLMVNAERMRRGRYRCLSAKFWTWWVEEFGRWAW